jgi:hypothetical protein
MNKDSYFLQNVKLLTISLILIDYTIKSQNPSYLPDLLTFMIILPVSLISLIINNFFTRC